MGLGSVTVGTGAARANNYNSGYRYAAYYGDPSYFIMVLIQATLTSAPIDDPGRGETGDTVLIGSVTVRF